MFLRIFSHIFHCLKKGNTSDIPHCKGFVASFLFYKRHDNRVVVVSALVHYESTRSTRFFFPLKNIFSRVRFHIPKTKTKNSNVLLTTPSQADPTPTPLWKMNPPSIHGANFTTNKQKNRQVANEQFPSTYMKLLKTHNPVVSQEKCW